LTNKIRNIKIEIFNLKERGNPMKYRVYFYFDPQYKGYVADALDLPGCVSQGKTLEDAKLNIKEAIEGYLAVEQEKDSDSRSYFVPEEALIGEVAVG
jgi:predicted RNase H-like HicB family nuclease